MDFLQDYTPLLRLLPPHLSHPLLSLLTNTLALTKTIHTHLSPLLTRLTTAPDALTIILLLLLLLVSLKALNMLYRAVLFWIKLAIRVVVLGGMVGVGLWISKRGVDGFVEDVVELGRLWWSEYEKFGGEVRGREKVERRRAEEKIGRGGSRGWR